MTNEDRRRIVNEAKMQGYQGSYVDLFKQFKQNPTEFNVGGMYEAVTQDQKQDGLRPLHEAGETGASMAFRDVPPNTPFNTMGMKAPIDIKKYDEQGHLVKSYENVPPGLTNLDTGPHRGTVLETPSRMQGGGPVKEETGPRRPPPPEPKYDDPSTYNYQGWLDSGGVSQINSEDGRMHQHSVDPYTGMWLKSKKHKTAWKEHLHSQLSPDPFFKKNMSVVNPEGYFGEDQLQYVPRKKAQEGAFNANVQSNTTMQSAETANPGFLRPNFTQNFSEDTTVSYDDGNVTRNQAFETTRGNRVRGSQTFSMTDPQGNVTTQIDKYRNSRMMGLIPPRSTSKIIYPDQKRYGGRVRAQEGQFVTAGPTEPDFVATGPKVRIDGEDYQATKRTGATRTAMQRTPDGEMAPSVLLPAAEVVTAQEREVNIGDNEYSRQGAEDVYAAQADFAGKMGAAAADYFTAPQRYTTGALISLLAGKKPNLSATPFLDRSFGVASPNALPSETLGINNPVGAVAVDIATDPMGALSLASIARGGYKYGQNYFLRRQMQREMGTGAASISKNPLDNPAIQRMTEEFNNPRIYTMNDQLAFQDAAIASDVGISEAYGAVGKEFYSADAKRLYNMTPSVIRSGVDETLAIYGGKQTANVSAELAAQNQDRVRSVITGLYSNADDAALAAANKELRYQHMSTSSMIQSRGTAQLPFRPVNRYDIVPSTGEYVNVGDDIAEKYLRQLRSRARFGPNVSLQTRNDLVRGQYSYVGKDLKVTTGNPTQADMNQYLFGAQSTARHEAGHHVVTHMTPLQVEELNKRLISPITRDPYVSGMPHNDYLLSSRGIEIQARALESRAHFLNNANMPGTNLYNLEGIESMMNKVGNDPAFAKEFLAEARRLPGGKDNDIFDVMKISGDDITDALSYLNIMKYATAVTGVGYGVSQAAGNEQYKKGGTVPYNNSWYRK